MRVIHAEQGTPEWLAARVGRVTASRVADVMAKTKTGYSTSRAQYMVELICERLTGRQIDFFTNADMQRGTDLEPIARAMYEIQRDVSVQQVGLVLHPTLDMAGASPDGLVGDDGLIEIKCPRPHVHLDYLEAGKPPTKYQPQMGWQCICTGRKWVDFVSYCAEMPEELQLFVVRFTPSADYLAELEREVVAFLADLDARMVGIQKLREKEKA